MGLFESLAQLSKTLLTIDVELKHLREALSETRQEVRGLISDMQEVRERLARLEASRDADRAQMQADLARFQAEVERAELRLTRLLPTQDEPRKLPEQREAR